MIYILAFLLIIKHSYFLLKNYQQNHYNFKKTIISSKGYLLSFYSLILILSNVLIFTNNKYFLVLTVVLMTVLLVSKKKSIIPLSYTRRLFGVLIIYLTVTSILYIFIYKYFCAFVLINYISLGMTFYLEIPIKIIRKNKYIRLAEDNLKNKNLLKIGITGSYGKTTLKHILKHVLESKYCTLATPKSYNTLFGITKTINDYLNNSIEVFIIEMGAFKKGDILELSNLISPDIGVITEVGKQHLSTFKNINNVLNTKFEIATNMAYNSYLVLNTGNVLIKEKKVSNIKNIMSVDPFGTTGIHAENIILTPFNTTFDIYNDDLFVMNIETTLLTKAAVINILLAYQVILCCRKKGIEISDNKFSQEIRTLSAFDHRLAYFKDENIHIYDDSYNGNIEGLKYTIEVFKNIKEKKYIITPGLVDLGHLEKSVNQELAKLLNDTFDYIYIVNNKSAKYLQLELKEKAKVFSTFQEAFHEVKKTTETVYLLIANDLPDNFKERF